MDAMRDQIVVKGLAKSSSQAKMLNESIADDNLHLTVTRGQGELLSGMLDMSMTSRDVKPEQKPLPKKRIIKPPVFPKQKNLGY